ncbi:subtilisin-like protein [Ramaria rubella]|nr:subtilisin-like protein [Ramaria rubella]
MAKLLYALLAIVSAALSVHGSPATGCKHVLKETFFPTKEWIKQGPPPPDHAMTLRIDLAQPSFYALEEHLYAVSDPDSPRYGQHLSKEHVQELAAPSPQGLSAVNDWLLSAGFDLNSVIRSPSLNWVKLKTSVQQAEEMLNTTYHVWKNSKTGESLVRTTSWSLPDHLHQHIDLVHPTTMFRSIQPHATTFRLSNKAPGKAAVISIPSDSPTAVDPSCNTTITPTCLLQLYNATQYKVQSAKKGNKIAISSYLGQFANIADLQQFFKMLRPEAVGSSFNVVSINGGENNQTGTEAGDEANLDTQYAFSLTFPTPATVFTTGGSPPFIPDDNTPTNTNEPYLDWIDFVLDQPIEVIPQTSAYILLSTSYGDDEQTVPESFAKTVCNKFAQLGRYRDILLEYLLNWSSGARGVTLTFSSGDNGVGDGDPNPATSDCLTNDGTNQTKFIPAFPASCPFVTSVGGTVGVPETAVTRFGSGGGFSNFIYLFASLFAYQDAAVTAFLKVQGNTNKGLFNPNGRGYPDVAAQGDNFEIVLDKEVFLIGGTSAASPTFAGIVSLLNDARIAAGKPSLGFLNPLLYSKATKAFNDITVGNNPGCGTEGFFCIKGWDAGIYHQIIISIRITESISG